MKAHERQASSTRIPLVSPWIDPLLLGGGSIVLSLLLWAFPFKASNLVQNQWIILALFSYPHFMASYFVFYRDRSVLKTHPWIGFRIPLVLLISLLTVGIYSEIGLRIIAHTTLALLYWHFLKQTYGVSLWMGTKMQRKLNPLKKQLLLISLLFLGCYGFLGFETESGGIAVFMTSVQRLELPKAVLAWSRWIAYLTLLGFVTWVGANSFKRRENDFSWPGLIPIVALVLWFEPFFGSTLTFFVPVFHAIQYLPFPFRAFVVSHEKSEIKTFKLNGLFLAVGLIGVGTFAFRWGPMILSHWIYPLNIFAIIHLFLNIHHFLIDSVLWKFRDPKVIRMLQSPS